MKTTIHVLRMLALLALLLGCGRVQGQVNTGGSVSLPTTLSAPGVFTNTQMNLNLAVELNSCNPTTVFQNAHSSQVATMPYLSCLSTPSTTTTNLWNDGFESLLVNNQAYTTNNPGVAFDAVAKSAVNGARSWGFNDVSFTPTGLTGAASIYGLEADLVPQNTTDSAWGVELVSFATANPTLFNAVDISNFTPGTTQPWNIGVNINNGATLNSGAFKWAAINIGTATASTNPDQSQELVFHARTSGGADTPLHLFEVIDANGLIRFTSAENYTLATFVKKNVSTFAQLTAIITSCNATEQGVTAIVTDSTTTTVGATITGGGANHVTAECNATNWIVLGPG